MPDYLTVRSHGVVTYCDGLIARIQEDQAEAYLLSLVGSPEHIQATSTHFTMGGCCHISGIEPVPIELGRAPGPLRSIRARRIGDVVTRVIISADQFARTALQTETVCSAIVFGMDLATVRQQAWHRLANSTTVPLQPEWRDWLWDEVLQPERLYSFGNPQRRQAWRISWQEEELAERVRAGFREQALG